MAAEAAGRSEGVVVAFDEHRGLGEVEDGRGRRYPFHCTSIADRTRTVAVGTPVTFRIDRGPLAPEEAFALAKLC